MQGGEEDNDQKAMEEKPPPLVELFDPWNKRLGFDKPYRFPKILDLSDDLSEAVD